jgi:hypothetical protein
MSLRAQLKKKKKSLDFKEISVEVVEGVEVIITEMTYGEVTAISESDDPGGDGIQSLMRHSFVEDAKGLRIPAFDSIEEVGDLPVEQVTDFVEKMMSLSNKGAPEVQETEGNAA